MNTRRAPLVRPKDSAEFVLAELAAHVPALLVSKRRGGMVIGACGAWAVNLVEVARLVVHLHNFASDYSAIDLDTHSFASVHKTRRTAAELYYLVLSLKIDEDLALCIVMPAAEDNSGAAMKAFVRAGSRLRGLASTQEINVRVPASGTGGQGAAAEAGLAQYLPRKPDQSS